MPPQVNQSEKMQGYICSHSVSTRGPSSLIVAFRDQSSIVLNSLSFWSLLGESTCITASSHITAVTTHTALKMAPCLAALLRGRICSLVLGEDLAETPEYQILATEEHWNLSQDPTVTSVREEPWLQNRGWDDHGCNKRSRSSFFASPSVSWHNHKQLFCSS